ncbi:MAG: sulfatase [Bacteroidetes Order II. Incertae sedis bacterium]|nr:sulfatase [Bacteroidetes Order II. bacterium]
MNRVLTFICAFALFGCSSPEPDLIDSAQPNLLFIITDDQRFDMMGVVNPMLETPNMDRLATDGVRFENAFVTTPICAASRASFLTGLVERTHQYTFGTAPLATRFTDASYPTLLREAGYHTGMIGKFGVNTEMNVVSDSLFDVFEPFAAAPYLREDTDGSIRHLTEITTNRAIDYLRARDGSAPFALTLSFNAPHADDGDERQFIWPENMDKKYADITISDPPLSDPSFYEAQPEFLKDASLNRVRWFWRFDTPEKVQGMTKGHLRMISGVDAGIGKVMNELQSLQIADNTIIILMGDNGYFLGERGYAGKWLPYELSIRVPLIIFDPRTDSTHRGTTPSEPVLNIDIAPTLLHLAGVDVPEIMQGRSLVPLVQGRQISDWRADFFVEHLFNHPQIPKHEGVRGERFKYARYFEQNPVYEELYDLQSDPMETINLASNPEYASILNALQARTNELQTAYGGPFTPRQP